jgi:hypothetical protein
MTLRQLKPHRSRVPAIPPRVKTVTLQWSFDMPDDPETQPAEWRAFLDVHRFDFVQPVGTFQNGHWTCLKEVLRAEGAELKSEITWPPGSRARHVTLTVIRAPRISPKLRATFPWKLRRLPPTP